MGLGHHTNNKINNDNDNDNDNNNKTTTYSHKNELISESVRKLSIFDKLRGYEEQYVI